MAAHDHRLPRGQGDRDPARAPVGQPARAVGATTRRARTSTSTGSRSRPTPTACRSTATCSASAFEVVRADDAQLVAQLDYGAHPDKLRAFPFPHTVTVDARARRRARARRSRPRSGRRPTAPVPISFGWHPYVRLPSGGRATLGAALARVRARRGRRRASIPTGVRTPQPADRAPIGEPHVRRPLRARRRPHVRGLGRGPHAHARSSTRRTRSRSCSCRPAANSLAIEPMTAEIDALGRGTAPVVAPGDRFRAALHGLVRHRELTQTSGSFTAMPGALDGVRILDLSWGIAGPLGVLLLAEQGADVIKVEPPGGDPFRAYDGYRVWNRSRRSLTVDLKSDRRPGRVRPPARHRRRRRRVVPARRHGTPRLRLRRRARRAPARRLPVVPRVSRTATASRNRPGYDALVQASSGQMWEQPGWRMGPIFLHMPMPSMGAFYLDLAPACSPR